jgi:putative ABC transport system ATP-binding protein|uniref:ABC transporter ATP-binding protein n=1 Tax=Desulfobacca acetoxidans TaxID=60893 RepID=A0A7C3Z1K3_9BACT
MEPKPEPSPSPLIRVADMTKIYHNGAGPIEVLRQVDLEIYPGEMVAVMGPSGSGKSTLLYILGLLQAPTSGSYFWEDTDVLTLDRSQQAEFRRRRLGFVFQACDLLENSTVYENLEFPLIYEGVDKKERPPRIREALERVNLGHRLYHSSNLLSGGERQRVAVARALVNRPQLILADEPTGQLDRRHGHLIMEHFEEIIAGGDTSVVVVTHDPEIAARCTRVCPMEDGVLRGLRQ